jgi:hypothetical protein
LKQSAQKTNGLSVQVIKSVPAGMDLIVQPTALARKILSLLALQLLVIVVSQEMKMIVAAQISLPSLHPNYLHLPGFLATAVLLNLSGKLALMEVLQSQVSSLKFKILLVLGMLLHALRLMSK